MATQPEPNQNPTVDLAYISADLQPLAIPIDVPVLDPSNAREGHDLDGISGSLGIYTQRTPIVINVDQGNRTLKGNGTLKAARQLGWSHIAAVRVYDDAATATGYAIADNATGDKSHFNQETLAQLLASLPPEQATGFTDDEVAAILAEHERSVSAAGDSADAEPQNARKDELQAKWGTAEGQLWHLPTAHGHRGHRLICGDSRSDSLLARLTAGGVRLVWTDPPYAVNYVGKTADALTIQSDDLDEEGLDELLRTSFGLAHSLCVDGAVWYVCAPAGPLNRIFGNVLGDMKIWRQTLIWEKQHFVMGRSDYHYRHEPIFYGWTPGAKHYIVADRTLDTILKFDRPMASHDHPTMKPIDLIEFCIRNSSRLGDLVLDIFAGSGSTLIACENTGREFAGVELDAGYVAVILERYFEAFGIKGELIDV